VVIVSPLRGERFVGLVAEDVAEVSDRCGDFGKHRGGHGAEGETGDGSRDEGEARHGEELDRQHPLIDSIKGSLADHPAQPVTTASL
jgi:hypothetical protein